MTAKPAPSIGRIARWVLLLSTMFGLAMMHTLGHAGMRMGSHPRPDGHPVASVTATVALPATEVTSAVSDAVALACADDDCGGHGAMDGWSICMAVLGGLAVFTLLALLLGTLRHRGPTAAGSAVAGKRRPPPGRSAGLAVASTAVLRI